VKSKNYEKFIVALLVCFAGGAVFAHGGYYFHSFLLSGDDALLAAPCTTFSFELARMKLDPPRFHARPPTTNSYLEQSTEADLADLRSALRKSGLSADERKRVLDGYGTARLKLEEFIVTSSQWRWQNGEWIDGVFHPKSAERPQLEGLEIPAGVPAEFSDYLRASVAYRNGSTNEARQIWSDLLARPKGERHYRSTWATYMLGLTSDRDKPEEAIAYFAKTRALAGAGFADSLGLAAASLGWEAKANLSQQRYEAAIELYLQQYATGEDTAVASLRFAAGKALTNGVAALVPLAKNPRIQKVITAFITSRFVDTLPGNYSSATGTRDWLEAVAKAGIRSPEWAEQYALIAYQNDDFELAQRWVELARNSPVAQWIQAKLDLRAGRIRSAETLLSQLTALFPLEPPDTNDFTALRFKDCLVMTSYFEPPKSQVGQQIRGELGILQLGHGEYLESLDNLLHAGRLMDAAYVAERVLTIEELKSYVDGNWPYLGIANDATADPDAETRQTIRHLLGRRLTRLNRGSEAGPYYPAASQASHAAFMRHLTEAWEESRPAAARAASFFEAGKIAEEEGWNLLATEVEPDCRCFTYRGCFDLSPHFRLTNELTKLVKPLPDEIQRYDSHKPDPDVPSHYEYQAASLGWEAAKLLPNNSDQTAMVLWTAGDWVKYLDPKFADLFYKALVRRCRKTALGAEADRRRWFPMLDDEGRIIPRPVRANRAVEVPPPDLTTTTPEVPPGDEAAAPPQ
jgi:hypothetical protein